MKSLHVSPVRSAICFAALLAALGVAAPVSAQGIGFTVTTDRNGQPLTDVEVAVYAASESKRGTLTGTVVSFDADVINASLEGKPAAVFVDECEDGSVDIHLVVEDSGAQAPPSPCKGRRRRLAGVVILRRGSSIVVDVGRGTVVDLARRSLGEGGTSSGASSSDTGSGGSRLGIGAFGNVSGAWGGFNLGGPTGTVIGTRFNSTNPPYQQYNVDVDDSTSGFAFGGGLNLVLGGSSLGARIGLLRESERDVPQQSVNGERTQGGLRFQQLGTSIVRAWTLYAGPTMRLPLGIVVSGGPSFTFWDVELTQTAQLQAGCPTPCVTVITDNLTEQSSGSDLGFQVAADYYPRGGWIGMHVMYLLTTYRDAYDPSRPLGYPRDWRDSNFFVGAVVGTPQRRI
jgi:hypothetical protein